MFIPNAMEKIPLVVSCQKSKCGCNQQHQYFCCNTATCNDYLWKKRLEAYYKTIFNFVSITDENKSHDNNFENDKNLQEPHDSDDDDTIDVDLLFSNNSQNNYACSNDLDDFLGMCDPPGVEPDYISESNYHNFFVIGVVEYKENIEILPTTNDANKNFKVRAESSYGGQNNGFIISGSGLIYETTSILVPKPHNFHRSKL